jgi:putative PEP-CTERM system TPR-repeat lipoprotein
VGGFLKEDYGKAIDYLKRADALNAPDSSAGLSLAALYMRLGKVKEARAQLSSLLEKKPSDKKALTMLAYIQTSNNERDQALETYDIILKDHPTDLEALYKKGMLYVDKGRLDEADKIADKLTQGYPKMAEGYRLKGLVTFHKKDYAEAVSHLQKSITLQPNLGAYYVLGMSHYLRNEPEQALSELQKALDIDQSLFQARVLMSTILLSKNRVDSAIAEIKKVIEKNDRLAVAHNILGNAYLAKGMYDEGMSELDRAIELDPELVDARMKKGLMDLAKGRQGEAESEFRAAVKAAPELLNTRYILAAHYLKQKNNPKALQVIKEGITGKKEDALLYNMMSAILLSDGKAAEAVDALKKAKAANPDYLASYYNQAIYDTTRGEFDKAIAEYGEVLKKDPKNVRALLNIATLYGVKGNNSESLSYFMKAKETKDPGAYLALAKHYMAGKETKKAIGVLDEAIEADPKNAGAIELKGKIYASEKKYKDALKTFGELERLNADRALMLIVSTHMAMGEPRKAMDKLNDKINENPKSAELIVELAKVHLAAKDPDGAMEQARKLIAMRPDASEAYMVVAMVYESKGDLDSAMKELRKGFDVDKDGFAAGVMLGDIYVRKGDLPKALKTYEEVSKRNAGYAPALFSQGMVYERMGKKKEAVGSYREVVRRSAKYVPAMNNLAYLYAEGYGSKEEALALATQAYRLDPNSVSIMDTLGYALVKNGRHDDARKILDRSVALAPDNPVIRYHAALAYSGLGDKKKSIEHLEKALSHEGFPEATRAKELLQKLRKS